MPTQLAILLDQFAGLWPLDGAESWDAPGLVSGSPDQTITKVLLTVDVTSAVIDYAAQEGFNLVLAHHPYLMRGVTNLAESNPKGAVIASAIRSSVAIYAAHTNADIVENGVSDAIAKALGLVNITPLAQRQQNVGHGRIGVLPNAVPLGEFARLVAKTLPSTAAGVKVAGDYNQLVQKVALCGGAGDSFITDAQQQLADVYLSSDLRHHPAQDAREFAAHSNNMALIDVAHWASEWLWLDVAAQQLRTLNPELEFEVCDLNTDPWDFVITQ